VSTPANRPSASRGAHRLNKGFLIAAAIIVAVILYGSLYPFTFYQPEGGAGPLKHLVQSWAEKPGRGDFIANIFLYLPLGFGAGSDVNYTYSAATQTFIAQYTTIWNAYIFKSFRKDESFKISLSANDLLNQNTNFTRGLSGNTSTQTNTNGIKRFFMLSLIWDFTKFGTLPPKK